MFDSNIKAFIPRNRPLEPIFRGKKCCDWPIGSLPSGIVLVKNLVEIAQLKVFLCLIKDGIYDENSAIHQDGV